MKKNGILSLAVLLLAFALLALAPPARADGYTAEGACGESVTWKLRSDGILILEGTGATYDYNDAYDRSIPWYSYQNDIKGIEVGNGITSIGRYLLSRLSNATYLSLPKTLSSIGSSAFFYDTSLESVVFPAGLTSLGDSAFMYCFSLKSIDLPNGLTEIKVDTFHGCKSVESVTIPASVTKIGSGAFSSNHALKDITLPDGLTVLGSGAFYWCDSLKSITVPDGVTELVSTFVKCEALETAVLPDGVTLLHSTFSDCPSLKNVNIPASLETLKGGVFYNCAIESVELPAGVTILGDLSYDNTSGVFCCCHSLKSVTLPEGLKQIGGRAFYYCNSLESITIPDSVTDIGGEAFRDCTHLTEINLPRSLKAIPHEMCRECTLLKTVTIPGKTATTEIGYWAFYKCPIESFHVPSGVTRLSEGAFQDCKHLADVTLPDSLNYFGYSTNHGGESVGGVFEGCIALESVVLPPHVRYLNSDLFNGCTMLKDVTVGRGTEYIWYNAFDGCAALKSIVLPQALKEIERGAFSGCYRLETITLPKRLGKVADSAFYGCNPLTIYYDGTDEQWAAIKIGENHNSALLNGERHPYQYPAEYATITFIANGGGGAMTAQTVTVGKATALNMNTFTKEHYRFKRWSTTKDDKDKEYPTRYDNGAEIYVYEDLTLYAQWEYVTRCSISFYANGGVGSMDTQYVNSGESVTLQPCAFIRAGYVFTGWNKNSGGTSTAYADGEAITTNSSISLYAQWRRTDETYAVAGWFNSSGYLCASYLAPSDTLLIAACYDGTGRLVDVATYSVSGESYHSTSLSRREGCTYKLMLASRTSFAPLCAAWEG